MKSLATSLRLLRTRDEEARLAPLLQEAAREISVRLGAGVYPFGK